MKVISENLGKRFNREWVFRNFSYEFNSGNTYVITGPNGSGKSTLMQVLWGQMQPSAGSVNYAGIDLTELYRSVAIATPYMDLIEEFTLNEIIRFHFQFKRCRVPINQVIEKAELESSRLKPISTFSSGMKQRLKLALAFCSDCELLFLDEPCTNLDKKSIEWYHANLRQVPLQSVIFIASNQEIEYPSFASKIDILSYK
jgi:ABC-type multidrug transport system ATPase subunit